MRRSCIAAAALALAACSPPKPDRSSPAAEFLVATGDSTFWVSSGPGGVRVRGAPLTLARWGGSFHEIYVVDDDRSFQDAIFVGQRVYRRELATGDSALVYEDTVVPRLADDYAGDNPGARPLGPDDEEPDDPATSATATIELLDVHGPYVSYEYHLDSQAPETAPWHSTHRGVIDLRATGSARLADLVGPSAAAQVLARARAAFRSTEDSIRFARDARARRAARALASFRFDDRSFVLTALRGQPAVAFDAPGIGEGASGLTLPVPPVALVSLEAWDEARPTLLDETREGSSWRGAGYTLRIRADSAPDDDVELARLALVDSAGHEWPVATVVGPVRRVFALDRPRVSETQRRALVRSFEEAALYDETTRTARRGSPSPLGAVLARAVPRGRAATHRSTTHRRTTGAPRASRLSDHA